jgi:hypothetical protein
MERQLRGKCRRIHRRSAHEEILHLETPEGKVVEIIMTDGSFIDEANPYVTKNFDLLVAEEAKLAEKLWTRRQQAVLDQLEELAAQTYVPRQSIWK